MRPPNASRGSGQQTNGNGNGGPVEGQAPQQQGMGRGGQPGRGRGGPRGGGGRGGQGGIRPPRTEGA